MAPRPDQQSSSADEQTADATVGVKETALLKEDLLQVDGVLYDAASLASIHPGGELFVKSFAGRDATEAFLSYHRREFPHTKYTDHSVGATKSTKDDKNADKEYLELCEIIEKILPRHKSYAPASYFVKVAAIFAFIWTLEWYIHSTGSYKWYLTGLLGWGFALVGLNIQHDANHGAASRSPLVNRLLGLGQNWIGGSAVDWIHQHVVQHHVNCNDVDNDPDIVGNPILRFNPRAPIAQWHGFQYCYLFALLSLFGLTYITDSLKHVTEAFHYTKYSKLLEKNRLFEQCTILFMMFRWTVLPLLLKSADQSLLSLYANILPLYIVGGYYLSFFFVISHNFEGVEMHDNNYAKKIEQSFLRKQVATSSNVGGSVLCFVNGGLNYQIEHHLFPRISHTHYPKIAPVVREFCKSRNIPYVHFPTIMDNVASCARHMYTMGSQQTPPGWKGDITKEPVKLS